MVISVSRRTDIPAFYSSWFYNRIKDGYFLVRNPMNIHQVSKVSLKKEDVDCIVFWSKNPRPMMNRLDKLEGYNYYFQFTLNSYDKTIEPNVPQKKYVLNTFKELSLKIGKEKVIWRYDPIILTDYYTKEYHYKWFEYLAKELYKYTDKCVISFLDLYKKTEKKLSGLNVLPITVTDMEEIAQRFSQIAKVHELTIESCCEVVSLEKYDIKHGRCIDDRLIAKLSGHDILVYKDSNQRNSCGCVKSIDMGEYNTCKHGCKYCYANFNDEIVIKKYSNHKLKAPLLIGDIEDGDRIFERKDKKNNIIQLNFLHL